LHALPYLTKDGFIYFAGASRLPCPFPDCSRSTAWIARSAALGLSERAVDSSGRLTPARFAAHRISYARPGSVRQPITVVARPGPTEAGRATLGEESLGTAQLRGSPFSPPDTSPQSSATNWLLARSGNSRPPISPSPCSAGHPGRSRNYGYALVFTCWTDLALQASFLDEATQGMRNFRQADAIIAGRGLRVRHHFR
jgi:hypothetical protein